MWLRRQECIDKFGHYLQWAIPGYVVPVEGVEDNGQDHDAGDHDGQEEPYGVSEAQTVQETDLLPNPFVPYKIAKHVPYPCTLLDTIETAYSAEFFIDCLDTFLSAHKRKPRNFDTLSQHVHYPVFKRFIVHLPISAWCAAESTLDPICAIPKIRRSGLKDPSPEHFDTVIARKKAPPSGSKPGIFNPEGIFCFLS